MDTFCWPSESVLLIVHLFLHHLFIRSLSNHPCMLSTQKIAGTEVNDRALLSRRFTKASVINAMMKVLGTLWEQRQRVSYPAWKIWVKFPTKMNKCE